MVTGRITEDNTLQVLLASINHHGQQVVCVNVTCDDGAGGDNGAGGGDGDVGGDGGRQKNDGCDYKGGSDDDDEGGGDERESDDKGSRKNDSDVYDNSGDGNDGDDDDCWREDVDDDHQSVGASKVKQDEKIIEKLARAGSNNKNKKTIKMSKKVSGGTIEKEMGRKICYLKEFSAYR